MAELAKEVLQVNLEDEMRQSYVDYAMSVIVGRALPDVRDGLKPVHRRVLFAILFMLSMPPLILSGLSLYFYYEVRKAADEK